mgnify:CR=1 FL=1
MNKYLQLKEKHRKEFDKFPMFFAFNLKQFAEGMKKLDLTENDTDKICSFGNTGGYFKKSDSKILDEILNRHKKERDEALRDDEYLYQAILYELRNYEYIITYDIEPTLKAIGLTIDDLNNERISKIFKQAKADYLKLHKE